MARLLVVALSALLALAAGVCTNLVVGSGGACSASGALTLDNGCATDLAACSVLLAPGFDITLGAGLTGDVVFPVGLTLINASNLVFDSAIGATTVSFPGLVTLQANLQFLGTYATLSYFSFPVLTSVGDIKAGDYSNPVLFASNLTAGFEFPALVTAGNIAIQNAEGFATFDFPYLWRAYAVNLMNTNVTELFLPRLSYLTWCLGASNNPKLKSILAPSLTNASTLGIRYNPVLDTICIQNMIPTNFGITIYGSPFVNGPLMRNVEFVGFSVSALINVCNPAYSATDCNGTAQADLSGCPQAIVYVPPPTSGPSTSSPTSATTASPTTGAVAAPPPPESKTCQTGGVCPNDNQIYPIPGYWNAGLDSGFVEECPEPAAIRCLGGVNSTCGFGYAGRLCANCAPGFYARGGTDCTPCPTYENSQAVLYAVNAVILALFGATHVVLDDAKLDYAVTVFKVLQLVRIAGQKTGHALPDGMKDVYDNLALVTFDYAFLKPQCGGPGVFDFSRMFWGNAIVIAVAVVPAVLVLVLLALFNKSRRQMWTDRLVRTVIVYATLIYFVVVVRSIQSCACITMGDTRILKAFTDQACVTPATTGVGIFALVVFVALLPMLITWDLLRLKRRQRLLEPGVKARYGYMYHKLKTDHYRFMYEAVRLLHLFFIALAFNAFPNNDSPYAFSLAIYTIMFILSVAWRPLLSPMSNAITVLSVGLGWIGALANFVTLSSAANPAAALPVVVVFFIVVLILTVAVFVYEKKHEAETKAAEGIADQGKTKKNKKLASGSESKEGSSSAVSLESGSKSGSNSSGSASGVGVVSGKKAAVAVQISASSSN